MTFFNAAKMRHEDVARRHAELNRLDTIYGRDNVNGMCELVISGGRSGKALDDMALIAAFLSMVRLDLW